MSPTFKSNVKNENLRKCRIVAELFFKTSIREFFQGFQTNCTTRVKSELNLLINPGLKKSRFKVGLKQARDRKKPGLKSV